MGDWWENIKHKTESFFMVEGKRLASKKPEFQRRLRTKLQRHYNLSNFGLEVEEEIVQLKKDMIKLLNEKTCNSDFYVEST